MDRCGADGNPARRRRGRRTGSLLSADNSARANSHAMAWIRASVLRRTCSSRASSSARVTPLMTCPRARSLRQPPRADATRCSAPSPARSRTPHRAPARRRPAALPATRTATAPASSGLCVAQLVADRVENLRDAAQVPASRVLAGGGGRVQSPFELSGLLDTYRTRDLNENSPCSCSRAGQGLFLSSGRYWV
jgi:hypothetical protein